MVVNKVVVYLRTSTFDQNPENQLKECLSLAEGRGYSDVEVFREHLSGWKKDVSRPEYERIKLMAHRGEIKAVVVWALDRWIRNRDSLLDDVNYLAERGVKLHSVKDDYIEAINVDGALGRTIKDFMYGLIGSLAQMESDRKSERIRAARDNWSRPPNKKDWGRPKAKFNKHRAFYLLFDCGKSLRAVSSELGVSLATVQRFKKVVEKNPDSFIKE